MLKKYLFLRVPSRSSRLKCVFRGSQKEALNEQRQAGRQFRQREMFGRYEDAMHVLFNAYSLIH
ncbi:MAG: hypothetical protein GY801_24285 [bacterium]|nr:hypothetical protein [bacterium]